MKAYEALLKVNGWTSEYKSVQNLLNHLARKTSSEKSKSNYLQAVYYLCLFTHHDDPDKLTPKPTTRNKTEIEESVQAFIDDMKRQDRSIRYINVMLEQLKTFFKTNGYKKDKEIEVERYHQPARYRKRPEYIPTAEEVFRMVNSAIIPKWKAIILAFYTTGLRNSTLRAVLYGDIKSELEHGNDVIHVPVYPEMKKIVPDACKNLVPYHTYLSKEAVESLRSYLKDYELTTKVKLLDSSPLFPSRGNPNSPMKARSFQDIIKRTALIAGIKQWRDVYPHCMRKSFENAVRNAGLDVKDQEYLMGHILPGSQDAYMDKSRIEEFRAKHERIKFFQPSDPEGIRREAAKDQLKMLEALNILPKQQIESIRKELDQKPIDQIDWTEIVSRLKREGDKHVKAEEDGPEEQPRRPTRKDQQESRNDSRKEAPERSVTADEAESLIGNGWRYVGVLPNSKVVIAPTMIESDEIPPATQPDSRVFAEPPPPQHFAPQH